MMAAFLQAAVQGVSSYLQSEAKAKEFEQYAKIKYKDAQVAFKNAERMAWAANENEQIIREQAALDLSRRRVVGAYSGVSGGTVSEAEKETEQNMEADILMQRYNAQTAIDAAYYGAQQIADSSAMLQYNADSINDTKMFNALMASVGGYAGSGGFDSAFASAASAAPAVQSNELAINKTKQIIPYANNSRDSAATSSYSGNLGGFLSWS